MKKTQLKMSSGFVLFICAKIHLTDKNSSHMKCKVDLKPQKELLYTQVVHISIKTCDMTIKALSISKM